jgi:cell division initiation protein
MRISPLDIRKQPFRRKLWGCDPDEVSSFLKLVASEFEEIIHQNNESGTQIKMLEQKLEQFVKIERILNETLITAQKATDEARVNAQKEAELIIKDSIVRSERYENEARNRAHDLEGDIITLRNQRDSFLARFKAMLITQLNLLDVIGGDLKHNYDKKEHSIMELAEEETLAEVPPQPNISSLDV